MTIGEWIGTFFTAPGPGGVVIILVIILAGTIYTLLTRWILRGGEDEVDRWRRR